MLFQAGGSGASLLEQEGEECCPSPWEKKKKKSEFIWDPNFARPVTKPDDCKVGCKLLTAVREPIISPLVVLSH